MALERKKNPERKTRSDILKAGLVAASLTAPFDHGPARAAEIPPEAAWLQGVAELQRDAREETVEDAATFLIYDDGSQEWLTPTRGKPNGGVRGPNTESIARTISEHQKAGLNTAVCEIHTHPAEVIEKYYGIEKTKAQRGYMPAWTGDIATAREREDLISLYVRQTGAHVDAYTAAIFDPQGVWYFRALTDTEAAQYPTERTLDDMLKAEEFMYLSTNFTSRSLTPEFNFESQYDDLRKIYQEKLHTVIRFVAYENLRHEPPCAGPDYQPVKE